MVWERLGSASVVFTPVNTSWKEIARTTLGSAGDTITVDNIPDRDNLMVLFHGIPSGQLACNFTLNNDATQNYAGRKSSNGGNDGEEDEKSNLWLNGQSRDNTVFSVFDILNIPSQEKLINGMLVDANTTGANSPDRREIVGKWANTSNAISRFDGNNVGTGDFASDSEIVILGFNNNESDSGTNFWQELASVELSSSSDLLDSGTFTSKKYLMVESLLVPTGGSISSEIGFNSDSAEGNYAVRRNYNGSNENTYAGSANPMNDRMYSGYGDTNHIRTVRMMIVNKSDKEKLIIGDGLTGNTEGASNPPNRWEFAGKWINTSAQISSVQLSNNGAGSYLTGSYIKVYGAD